MESNPLPSDNPAWFTDCFISLRELERRDAFDLGLCPTGAGDFNINPISEHPNSPDSQLSRFDDIFTILSFIVHQLSNLTPRDDISLWDASFEAMESLSEKLLGFESLLKMLVGLDCPTVRAASYGLIAWIEDTNNENMLRIFAETVLQQHSAAWFYRTHRLHGPLLVLAARFGFSSICEELIKNGVSPNQTAVFPGEGPYSFQPTALAEAAKMGNVDTAKILLDCGADVNFASRDYGPIAAGKLLLELKHDSLYRHQRLEILRLLLERGLDINAPCWGGLNTPDWAKQYTMTILDHVVLDGDEDVAAIFSISCADAGRVPSVSLGNIISHARMGSHELKNYLSNAAASSAQGSTSLIRAQKTALMWAMERGNTKVVLAMVLAGVDTRKLISYHHRTPMNQQNYLEEVFRNAPISPATSQLAFALLDSDQRTDVEEAIIKACLGSPHDNVIKFILDDFLGLEAAKNGVILLACAARLGQFTAVQMILQRCPGVLDEKTEFWNSHCSVLFMSAATFPRERPRLLDTPSPARVKMLDFLLQQGADINACHPRFWRSQHWISGEQLAWLVDNLARFESLEGISVYRMIFPRIQRWGKYGDMPFQVDKPFRTDTSDIEKAAEMAAVGKLFRQFAIPIFSLSESKLLQGRYYFETQQNPLSFFISLKPGNDFISSVINAGVDINGAGRSSWTDTPLKAAVKVNDLNLVKFLVSQGAKITKTESSYHFTTLQLAAGAPLRSFRSHLSSKADGTIDPRIAEFLLQQGADPNGRARICCVSPLQIAEDPPIVQHLLDNGANPREVVRRCPRCKNCGGESFFESLRFWHRRMEAMGILHFAVLRFLRTPTNASKRAVELLVSRGADIDKRLFDVRIRLMEIAPLAFTALEVAMGALQRVDPEVDLYGSLRQRYPSNIAMVELLLSHKAQVNPPSTYSGPSALAIACDMQDLQMVRVLLRHGASPNPHISESPPPLSVAAATGNLGLIVMLLCAGADMGVSTLTKHPIGSPITAAARHGRLDTVSLLLNFEQPPEILGKAVSLAFRKGFIEVAECIRRHMEQKGLEDPAAEERIRAGTGEVSEDNRKYRGLWGDGYYFGDDDNHDDDHHYEDVDINYDSD